MHSKSVLPANLAAAELIEGDARSSQQLERMLMETERVREGQTLVAARLDELQEMLETVVASTDGLRGVVEFLRAVARPRVTLQPVPLADLRRLSYAEQRWEACGSQALFEMIAEGGRLPSGWVHLEFELCAGGELSLTPRLFLGSRTTVIERGLPPPVDGRVSAIIYFGVGHTDVGFSPIDRPGRFSQSPFRVRELSRPEAAALLIASLLRQEAARPGKLRRLQKLGKSVAQALTRPRQALTDLHEASLVRRETDYSAWLRRYEHLTGEDLSLIRAHAARLPWMPRFLIVVVGDGFGADQCMAAVDAIRRQLCGNWEARVLLDSSNGDSVVYEEIAALEDRRVSVASTLQEALRSSRAELVCLLRASQLLSDTAVYRASVEMNGHPDADGLFSDWDSLDGAQRADPRFNASWDPDRFFEYPFPLGFAAFRRAIVDQVLLRVPGEVPPEPEELAVRCIARSALARLRHVPHVLLHATEPARTLEERWANATIAARREIVTARFPLAEVSVIGDHALRIRHPVPTPAPLVSLIIPTRDGYDTLRPCVESILEKTTYREYELLIVDNDSRDEITRHYLYSLEHGGVARVLRYPRPFNYAAINNFAARQARGAVLGLLNDDVAVISADWLREMVGHALRAEVGAVGAKLLYPDGRLQHCGAVLGVNRVAGHIFGRAEDGLNPRTRFTHEVSAVTGACLVLRADLYALSGGLDEDHLPVAYNDVDLCLRLREHGLRNIWTPHATLYHHESMTRGADITREQRRRLESEIRYMHLRWGRVLETDPFYSPNLTLSAVDGGLAWPPRVRWPWIPARPVVKRPAPPGVRRVKAGNGS
jgi:GT2 family glycosyltransferase